VSADVVAVAPIVCDLDAVGLDDLGLAGGKGAALGALRGAGIAVPDGFLVTPAAYREFAAANDLAGRIGERLAGADGDGGLDQAAADIHVGLATARIPGAVGEAIVARYLALSGAPERATVAVRSSTIGPDTPSRALAHATDTFLCVHGADAVLDAVRDCWASLYRARAIRARRRLGLSDEAGELAVLVQRQVEAVRAGTIVTAPAELLVEATYGLGEAASAGLVTPDRYVVARDGWRVVDSVIHRKDVVVEECPPHRGTRVRHVDPEQAVYPALRASQLRELAQLGAAVEDALGAPQRIEWALDRAGTAWIVQATPA